jgi:hypothetical protein
LRTAHAQLVRKLQRAAHDAPSTFLTLDDAGAIKHA